MGIVAIAAAKRGLVAAPAAPIKNHSLKIGISTKEFKVILVSMAPKNKNWLLLLPWLILIGLILPFSIFREAGDPWYLSLTSMLAIVAMLFFYPATWVTTIAGFKMLGVVHWLANVLLAIGYTFLLFKFIRRKKESKKIFSKFPRRP